MIYIGLNENQKIEKIKKYVEKNSIKHVIIFSGEIGGSVTKTKTIEPSYAFHLNVKRLNMTEIPYIFAGQAPAEVPENSVEIYGWADSILYRVFYELLARIDNTYLIVINEFMRSKNANALEYNCVAHYTGQTEHIMTFEYFPVIDDKSDFMMLVNLDASKRFKGVSINDMDFDLIHIEGKRHQPELSVREIELTDKEKQEYVKKAESLFDNLGEKDPDTIPRDLHIWTGKYKKKYIEKDSEYVARNARFKADNVTTYKDIKSGNQYKILDFCLRKLSFNDFLKITGTETVEYISTGLSIDEAYIEQFNKFKRECEFIYDKADI